MIVTGQDQNDAVARMQPDRTPPWTIANTLIEHVCGHAQEVGALALTLTFDAETLGGTDETRAILRQRAARPCKACRS